MDEIEKRLNKLTQRMIFWNSVISLVIILATAFLIIT